MVIDKLYISPSFQKPHMPVNNITFLLTEGKVLSYSSFHWKIDETPSALFSPNSVIKEIVSTYTDPSGGKFVDFSTGKDHLLFLNDKGELFGMGKNTHGILVGSAPRIDNAPTKLKTPNDEKVVKAFASRENTHILTDEGNVYSLGTNKYGQLGMGATTERVKWVKPDVPEGTKFTDLIVDKEQGPVSVYARTDKGDIAVFGTTTAIFSEAGVKKSNWTSKTLDVLPIKDTKVAFNKGNPLFIHKDDIYEASVYNSSHTKKIELTHKATLPGVVDITEDTATTKSGDVFFLKKFGSHNPYRVIPMNIGYHVENPENLLPFEAEYEKTQEMLTTSPKKVLYVCSSDDFASKPRTIINARDNAYIISRDDEGYFLRSGSTRTLAAVTGTFLNYDNDFISGTMREGCGE